jgi:hypothetical protein
MRFGPAHGYGECHLSGRMLTGCPQGRSRPQCGDATWITVPMKTQAAIGAGGRRCNAGTSPEVRRGTASATLSCAMFVGP